MVTEIFVFVFVFKYWGRYRVKTAYITMLDRVLKIVGSLSVTKSSFSVKKVLNGLELFEVKLIWKSPLTIIGNLSSSLVSNIKLIIQVLPTGLVDGEHFSLLLPYQ